MGKLTDQSYKGKRTVSNWKLNLYHHMPPLVRNWIASARGFYLRSWRYGSETEQLIDEALERDKWSDEQWKTYLENRLSYVLHRAATQVPYYRAIWEQRRRDGDKASWEYLENWPILTKQTLRENPTHFVAEDCSLNKMFMEQTSGTTGTPLKLWWSKQVIRGWYALFEARLRRWNGVSYKENWAILGGQQVVPAHITHPPFWVWNAPMHQLYLSATHISAKNTPHFVHAMSDYNITHLITYTSSATYLAQQILEQSLTPPSSLKVIITNAEPLFDWQRQILERGFGCNVRESYGMAEIVAAASEKEQHMYLWPEVGYVEVRDSQHDSLVGAGETGRLICTSLLNTDMPLIRYEVGDRGALGTDSTISPQSGLPTLSHIEGRQSDMLIAKDGRRVWWVNPIFYGLPVSEAQLIQETLDLITIKYVPTAEFTDLIAHEIVARLQARLGQIDVVMQPVDYIEREANLKFRPVICKLSVDRI